jgi:hypothetical protein
MHHSSHEYEQMALEWARSDPDKGHSANLALAQVYAILALAAVQAEIGRKKKAK